MAAALSLKTPSTALTASMLMASMSGCIFAPRYSEAPKQKRKTPLTASWWLRVSDHVLLKKIDLPHPARVWVLSMLIFVLRNIRESAGVHRGSVRRQPMPLCLATVSRRSRRSCRSRLGTISDSN